MNECKRCYYGMRLRGFSLGCQPMDGLIERLDDDGTHGRRYHDVLVYGRELSAAEIRMYELDRLGEKDV